MNEQTKQLFAAIRSANLPAICACIEADADVNAGDWCGRTPTPLHDAVWRLNVKAVQLLLDAGADTDARDDRGCTPTDLCRYQWGHLKETQGDNQT